MPPLEGSTCGRRPSNYSELTSSAESYKTVASTTTHSPATNSTRSSSYNYTQGRSSTLDQTYSKPNVTTKNLTLYLWWNVQIYAMVNCGVFKKKLMNVKCNTLHLSVSYYPELDQLICVGPSLRAVAIHIHKQIWMLYHTKTVYLDRANLRSAVMSGQLSSQLTSSNFKKKYNVSLYTLLLFQCKCSFHYTMMLYTFLYMSFV